MDAHQTPAGGVWIPALQALITGLLLGLLGWSLAALTGQARPYVWGALVATCAASWTWVHLVRRWLRLLEWQAGLEEQLRRDPEPAQVRVIVTEPDGQAGAFVDLVEDERLIALAERVYKRGANFTMGNFAGPGKLFSRSEFETLRAELMSWGLLAWKNARSPTQGVIFTGKGRAILRHYAAQAHPSPALVRPPRARSK